MKKLQGLLFDPDGTLLDSAPDLRQAVNILLANHQHPPLSLEIVKSLTGDGMMAFVERAFAAVGAPISGDTYPFVQDFIQSYRHLKPDPAQIYPHALEMIEFFKSKGVQLGICTNKQQAATHRILGELDLEKHFGFIAGGDTFEVHKPNPLHLLNTIEKLNVEPAGCVFIGDGMNDTVAARAAGLPCIVMTHGYTDDTEGLGAEKCIDGFYALPTALTELGFEWD